MKILYVTNGFPPEQWAGTETYTAGIAKAMHERGHDVRILCGGSWEAGNDYWQGTRQEAFYGVEVNRIDLNWTRAPDPNSYLYRNPEVAEYLKAFLSKSAVDIVHVTSCERLSASVLQTVKDAGLPLVVSLTDFWFICPRMSLLRSDGVNCTGVTSEWDCLECQLRGSRGFALSKRFLGQSVTSNLVTRASHHHRVSRVRGLRGMALNIDDRKRYLKTALALPDRLLTASTFVKNVFVQNDFPTTINVQPYGHDLAWLEQYTGKTPSEKIRFGFIGQIIPQKGVDILLQAAIKLSREYADQFSVVIYGNPQKDPAYGAQLATLGNAIANVSWGGTYAHEESGAVFSGIDVLVVPSIWYDFPLIIYEAFATDTPVIATRLGGMAEAVQHDVSGLLFERGSVDDLFLQMKRICTETELLAHLQSGISPVKSVAQEVAELEQIYRELVDSEIAAKP